MIKFSVLVPVYNVEPYLRQCMDSIVGQTYRNLEIICIDDGSKDHSGAILDEYAREDDRIIVIHKENTGYGASMNMGLEAAKGDYISIVESDDYIARDLYEKLASVIEEKEDVLDVIKTNHFRVSGSEIKKWDIYTEEHCGYITQVNDYKELFGFPCCIWGAAYRRKLLEEWNIRFLETPGASYQDTSFVFKVWAVAKKIYFIYDAYLFYRTDNINSSINSKDKTFFICEEIKEIEHFLDRYQLHELYLESGKGIFTCRAYMWNYQRLHPGFRSAFWVEMTRKFTEIAQSPGFLEEYWVKEYWDDIHRVLADPEGFFWQTNNELKHLELDQYTIKNDIYKNALIDYFQKQNIIIYGAGTYGKRVLGFLKKQKLRDRVVCFAVTEKKALPEKMEDIPVCRLEELLAWRENVLVIVAVAEKKQREILQNLRKNGFYKSVRVDDDFSALIRDVCKD